IRPTEDVGLVLHVPVRLHTPLLYFEIVRYFLALLAPYVAAAIAAVIGYPAVLKLMRTVLRRAWARGGGPGRRILVAYGELRDVANDLGIGQLGATPLEFLQSIDE